MRSREVGIETADADLLKVDVDQNRDLSGKYEVSSMPTFLFMKNGKVLDKMAGANIDSIKQKIGSYA